MEEASKRQGSLIDKETVIFDCAGMGFHQFHTQGLALLKAASEVNSNMYPERLGRLFIVNAPTVFAAAWSIVKTWLDKRIIDKIHILGSNYQKVLLEYIDADQLPKVIFL